MKMFPKKVKVKSLRNILASPFHLQWSKKSEEEIAPVRNALEKLLPAAKLEKKPLNKQLKSGQGIAEKTSIDSSREENVYRTYIAPGFQSVIRGLETKEICCVVLSDEISPISLQKVIFAYTHAYGVPTLVVPDLKKITKSSLGFTTMVMGFKNIVSESSDNLFHPIFRMVSENPQSVQAPFLLLQKDSNLSDKDVSKQFDEPPKKPQETKTENLYLYRENLNERVFIPQNKNSNISKTSFKMIKQEVGDFISIEKYTGKSTAINIKELASKNSSDGYDDDDDDDTDSCDDNLFFVDNRPDQSLMSTERQTSNHEKVQMKPPLTKQHQKKFHKNSFPNNMKNVQPSTGKSIKKSSGFNRSNNKNVHKNSSTINFRPLLVKSVTSNNSKNNKTQRKKKNK
uniref:Ribosomal protein L7Ae/L30e/S12e/Gadd45 domain-containing protein n=1 Tax=Graphocephala atropunctata TaxID=36148 RepID=A0A1B6KD45_9HEMI